MNRKEYLKLKKIKDIFDAPVGDFGDSDIMKLIDELLATYIPEVDQCPNCNSTELKATSCSPPAACNMGSIGYECCSCGKIFIKEIRSLD